MPEAARTRRWKLIDRLRSRRAALAAVATAAVVLVVILVVAIRASGARPETSAASAEPTRSLPDGTRSPSPGIAPASVNPDDIHERTPQPSVSVAAMAFRLTILGPVPETAAFALERGGAGTGPRAATYLCAPYDGYAPCEAGSSYAETEPFDAGTLLDYAFWREDASTGEREDLEAVAGMVVPSADTTIDVVYEFPQAVLGTRRVIVNDLRARAAPGTSGTPVAALQEGEIVTLREGPVLADGLTWWRVEVGSLDGWVADGTAAGPFLAEPGTAAFDDFNVWAATIGSELRESWRDIPVRVYVPNEAGDTVSVVDAATFEVIDTLSVGDVPLHVTPSWDGSRLYVDNMRSHTIQELDPRTGELGATIEVPGPYNLYFSLDGTRAIVMVEEQDRIDVYDTRTWDRLAAIDIPSEGVDHADLSAGGRYLLASTEFGGHVIKLDLVTLEIVGILEVGGRPVDVKLAPDGTVFYVANQERHGVSVIDPIAMTEMDFIPTGEGAHGLAISRDTRSLYVTNRDAGTVSVIDLSTRGVTTTWDVGSTPDMLQVSADGRQLWVSFRYDVNIGVIDTTSGGGPAPDQGWWGTARSCPVPAARTRQHRSQRGLPVA